MFKLESRWSSYASRIRSLSIISIGLLALSSSDHAEAQCEPGALELCAQSFPDEASRLARELAQSGDFSGFTALGYFYRYEAKDPIRALFFFEQALAGGDARATLAVGEMVARGEGTALDPVRARALLQEAADKGFPGPAMNNLGRLNRELGLYEEALENFEIAAGAGEPWAMLALAEMLVEGQGTGRDPERARGLIQQASDKGLIGPALDAFARLDRSLGQHADALANFDKAVAAGETRALLAIADMVVKGEGTTPDPDRARALLQQAVDKGLIGPATNALGRLNRDLGLYTEALQNFEIAAGAGEPWAMLAFAEMLVEGQGTGRDPDRARSLIQQASDKGLTGPALDAFARLDRSLGRHVDALANFEKAVAAGETRALLAIADMLVKGEGTTPDPNRARALLQQAADKGLTGPAMNALGRLNRDLGLYTEALENFERATEAGEPWAMFGLAEMLTQGQGAVANPDRARQLLAAARARGLPFSSTKLIETNMVTLNVTSFDITSFEPSLAIGHGAMGALGNRVLLADKTGRFYQIELGLKEPATSQLPFSLELNESQLLEHAAGRGRADVALTGVHDVRLLQGGIRLAVSYTYWDNERHCVSLNVALKDLPPDWRQAGPDGWNIIFRSDPCLPLQYSGRIFAGHQAAGRLAEARPGVLALTTGDFEFDGVNRTPAYPQDPGVDYGKTIEIDLESRTTVARTSGHRNHQGLAVDNSGQLWASEHGPRGGDELNLLLPGQDYGWPAVTLGTNYGNTPWQSTSFHANHDGYALPVFAWVPSIAVGSMIFSYGFVPEWEGDLLLGTLAGQQIRRLRIRDGRVLYDEPISVGERVRDIDLAAGSLILWTDSGRILVLKPNEPGQDSAESLLSRLAPEVRDIANACLECHTLGPDQIARISLRVFGKDIAAGQSLQYSDYLKRVEGSWNAENLDTFLADPAAMVPGTTMGYGGITDATLRRSVVEFLRQLQTP